jgi:hypothetical protein
MKSKTLHLILAAIVAAFILLAGVMAGLAQVVAPKAIACASCKYENAWAYKFCTNCGASLTAVKEDKLVELQREREAARRKAVDDSLRHVREAEMKRSQQAAPIVAKQIAPINAIAAPDTSVQASRALVASTEKSLQANLTTEPQAQVKDQQPWYKTMLREPAVLPRLFNVPTANVLGSLDIYFTGGGAFGIEKERNFLGRAGMGLGDIAEVEFATQSVINSLQRGSSSLPTSAFKMLIMRERPGSPAIAVALRGTTSWQSLDGSDSTSYFSFET